jgi:hypothetical protein
MAPETNRITLGENMKKYFFLYFILGINVFVFSQSNDVTYSDYELIKDEVISIKEDVENIRHELNSEAFIERVNSFYENAWSKLIYIFGGIGAILGIVIGVLTPYIIKKDQDKKYKLEIEKLKMEIEKKISDEIQSASNYISIESRSSLIKLETTIKDYVTKKIESLAK